jgi:hypothetical protein
MNWNNPDTNLPALAKRVVVETQEGSHLFAKLVKRPGKNVWIDDQSLPIRSPVVRWKEVVSGGETAA